MVGWKTIRLPLGARKLFRGRLTVKLREGINFQNLVWDVFFKDIRFFTLPPQKYLQANSQIFFSILDHPGKTHRSTRVRSVNYTEVKVSCRL